MTHLFYRFTFFTDLHNKLFSFIMITIALPISNFDISKRREIFEYLKNYVTSNGFIFLQETHSSVKDEKVWSDEIEGQLFFSHGETSSCGVATGLWVQRF